MATTTNVWDEAKAASFRGRGNLPLAKCVFDYTLLHYMGDVRGKTLMDVGCGEGRFCRTVKSKGASRVVGVDVSPLMVRFAQESEVQEASGCEYQIGDARNLNNISEFDFVTGTGLLPFAETISDLTAMCRSFCSNLKVGGKFCGVSVNCKENGDWADTLRPYGIATFSALPPTAEANRIQIIGRDPNQDGKVFEATLFYFQPEVYERVFKEVGFRTFRLEPVVLDAELCKEYSEGFWNVYLNKPSHLCYIAEK